MNYVRIGLLKWLCREPTVEEFNKIQIPDDLQNYFTGNKEEYEKKLNMKNPKTISKNIMRLLTAKQD